MAKAISLVVLGLLLLVATMEAKKGEKNCFTSPFALKFVQSQKQFIELPAITFGSSFSIEFLVRWRGASGPNMVFPVISINGSPDKIALSLESLGSGDLARVVVSLTDSRGNSNDVAQNLNFIQKEVWTYVAISATEKKTGTEISFFTQAATESDLKSGGKQTNLRISPWSAKRNPSFIGRNGENYFDGDLDEIRLWSSASITFNRNAIYKGTEKGLVAYWSFDEGKLRVAKDSCNSNYHATMGNFSPSWVSSYPVREGTCAAFGNRVDISTFDKFVYRQNKFNVYYFAQSTESNDINIQMRYNAGSKLFHCSAITGVAFQYQNDTVVIDTDFKNKGDSLIYINGVSDLRDQINLPSGIAISKSYSHKKHVYLITTAQNAFSLKVEAKPKKGETNVWLKLSSASYGNKLTGLCGDFNGVKELSISSDLMIVPSGNSLFPTTTFDGAQTDFVCEFPSSSPVQIASDAICRNADVVAPELGDACEFSVCVTQDITSAFFAVQQTYENCLAENGTSINTCVVPCPNFCSFQGDCINSVCSCKPGWGGIDCSQQKDYPCFKATWNSEMQTDSIEPFSEAATVVGHYKYEQPYLHSSNTGNEISDATVIYLYQDSRNNDSLSLVMINDKRRDGSGGTVTANLKLYNPSNGLPLNMRVSVKDDDKKDSFSTNFGSDLTASWKWFHCCTDGLAISELPLLSNFCLNLTLSNFNGISQVFLSQENLFGEQDLQSIPISNSKSSLRICGETCSNVCGNYSNCVDCASDSRCGWCSDSDMCLLGSAGGPRDARCPNWRYSTDNSVSRVITSEISYPIDPTALQVYVAPNQNLAVNFWVNFPPLDNIPQEVILLQEVSKEFWFELGFLKLGLVLALNAMTRNFPNTKLGLASFSDKPISPYGSASLQDYAYMTNQALTFSQNDISRAIYALNTINGGDREQSQLEALLQVARRNEIGWSDNARKIVLVITKSPYHTKVGGNLTQNNGDGVLDANEDYPEIWQVKEALLERNVVPLFITTEKLAPSYQSLVNQLGFGKVFGFSKSNLIGAIISALNSLEDIASNAQVVIHRAGKVSSVSSGYVGMSSMTRVGFSAFVDSSVVSNAPSVLVVPGFGKVQISYVTNDNPVPETCAITEARSDEVKIIPLRGSSMYGSTVRAKVTAVPTQGKLFQFNPDGSQGDLISGVAFVTDPGLRVIYVPNNSTGTYSTSISYKIFDDCDACSVERVCSISVEGVAIPPVAFADAGFIITTKNLVSDPLGVDGTGIGNILPIVVRFPEAGSLLDDLEPITIARPQISSKKVRFCPPLNVEGAPGNPIIASFCFVVVDSATNLQSSSVNVLLGVEQVASDPDPISTSFNVSGLEDDFIYIDLMAQGGSNLTYYISSLPMSANLALCENCSFINSNELPLLLPSNRVYFYPTLNFAGTTSFEFYVVETISDGNSFTSQNGTVGVFVIERNDPPTAIPQITTTLMDMNLPITLTGMDIEDSVITEFFICEWAGAVSGTLKTDVGVEIPAGVGMEIPLVGSIAHYISPPYTHTDVFFMFKVKDSNGDSSPCSRVDITVTRVDYVPDTVDEGSRTVFENTTSSFTLKTIDLNPEDTSRIFICSLPTKGSLSQTAGASILSEDTELIPVVKNGVYSTASVLYTCYGNDYGIAYTVFSFKAVGPDGNSTCRTVTIDVDNVNDPPYFVSPSIVSLSEDVLGEFNLTGGDFDLNSNVTFIVVVAPNEFDGILKQVDANGQITGNPISNGQSVFPNSLVFIPSPNYYGSTTFIVRAFDQLVYSEQAIITVVVNPVNDSPTSQSATVNASEDQPSIFSLYGSDIDSINLKFFLTSLPVGTLEVCSDANCNATSSVVLNVRYTSNIFQFTPVLNANGIALTSFTYQVEDDGVPLGTSAESTITFDVSPMNDAPEATPIQTFTVNDFENVTIFLNGTDIDTSSFLLRAAVLSVPPTGSLFNFDETPLLVGSLTTDSQQRVIYVPVRNSNHVNPVGSISYTLFDESLPSFAPGQVVINVLSQDLIPEALTTQAQGNEDTQIEIVLQGADSDGPGMSVFFTITVLPSLGALLNSAGQLINSTPTILENSTVTFVPLPDGFGLIYDSFAYTATNPINNSTSLPAIVNIDVTGVPDAPRAYLSVKPTVFEDVPLVFVLEGYDPDGDSFTASIFVSTTEGQLFNVGAENISLNRLFDNDQISSSSRLVKYVPPLNSNGLNYDFFSYLLTDSTGRSSAPLGVFIDILPVNDPPIAFPQVYVGPNNVNPFLILLNFTDVDNSTDLLTVTILSLPTGGSILRQDFSPVTIGNPTLTGTIAYFQATVYGSAGVPFTWFTYQVFDGVDTSNVVNETINIVMVNQIVDASATPSDVVCTEDSPSCFITFNATDPDDPNNGTGIVFELYEPFPPGTFYVGTTPIPTPPPFQRLPVSTNLTGWTIRWAPPANFTTTNVSDPSTNVPVILRYKVRDATNYFQNGQMQTMRLSVTAVNDAPYALYAIQVFAKMLPSPTFTVVQPGIINDYVLYDPDSGDNAIFNVSMDGVRCVNFTWNNPSLLSSVFDYTATSCSMRFRATKLAINNLFLGGITFYPTPPTPSVARLFIRMDDNGAWGQEAIPLNKFVNTTIFIDVTTQQTQVIFGQSAQLGGAVAAGTTLISAGVYALYKIMKRRKLLPEDADPWDTDEFFDKTLDNPLYSGTPTTSSAANVTLVTNDI